MKTRRYSEAQVFRILQEVDSGKPVVTATRERGVPKHVRSDNRPEFVARAVCQWLEESGCQTLFINPGSPWENDYIESFIDN